MRKKFLSLLLACSVVMSGNVYSTSVQAETGATEDDDRHTGDDIKYVSLSQTTMDNYYNKAVMVDYDLDAKDEDGAALYKKATYKRYASKRAYDLGKGAEASGNLSASKMLTSDGYYYCTITYNDSSSSVVNKRFTIDTTSPSISLSSGVSSTNGIKLATGTVKFNATDKNINKILVNKTSIEMGSDFVNMSVTTKDFELSTEVEEYKVGYEQTADGKGMKRDENGNLVPKMKKRYRFKLKAQVGTSKLKDNVSAEDIKKPSSWEDPVWKTKVLKTWTATSTESSCTILAVDKAENSKRVKIVWDKEKPKVNGVVGNRYYNSNRTCSASDKNLLNIQVKKGSKYYYYTKSKNSKLKTTDETDKYYYYKAEAKFTGEKKNAIKTFGKKSFTTKGDGKYTMIATDKAGNKNSTKFYIDTTKPTISGVKTGKVYNGAVTFTIKDNISGIAVATLNGKNIKTDNKTGSGSASSSGVYNLRVKDNAGNWNYAVFRIK